MYRNFADALLGKASKNPSGKLHPKCATTVGHGYHKRSAYRPAPSRPAASEGETALTRRSVCYQKDHFRTVPPPRSRDGSTERFHLRGRLRQTATRTLWLPETVHPTGSRNRTDRPACFGVPAVRLSRECDRTAVPGG